MDQDNESLEEQEQKRQNKILMARISYTDDPQGNTPKRYVYNTDSITPFLYFNKLLALRPCDKNHKFKLKLNVPDTIIFNDKDSPLMWIFTNEKGEVCRVDNVPYYTITSKLTEGALEKQVVAVLKKPEYGYGGISGNDVKVFSSAEIKTVLSEVLSSRGEVSVIQRFVKCNSPKASVMRTCWRKNGNCEGWILSSNYEFTSNAKVNEISKFIVNTKMAKAFNAVKCHSSKYLKQTLVYVKEIGKFVETYLKICFSELVCDFIKDEGGNWWFLNTRAFILSHDVKVDVKLITMHDDQPVENKEKQKLETYTRCRKCRYCYKTIAEHLMTHKLTLLMILQCDQHLIRLGKSFPWLERSYSLHLDSVNLYVEHKICDSCYKFYKEIEKLVNLENKLAILTGVKVPSDNRSAVSITSLPYFKGQSTEFGTRLQKMKYDVEMPLGWQLPRQQQLKIQLTNQNLTVEKYRWMVYIHGMRDIPVAYLDSTNKYAIQYELLGQRVRIPIKFDKYQLLQKDLFRIVTERIKVVYFFAEKRQYIKDYINKDPNLQILLFENDTVFGVLDLQLGEFKSDKVIRRDYFKMFSGKKVYPYLSWGLFVSIGLFQSGTIATSNLKLSKKYDLLVPEPEYHNPDPLPEDWITMIRDKQDRAIDKLQTSQDQSSRGSQQPKTNSNYLLSKQIEEYNSRKKAPSACEPRRKAYYS